MKKQCVSFIAVLLAVLFSASVSFAQADLYDKGVQAYLKKDYRSAAKYLKEYVSRKPDAEADAYYLLGYANYMLKRKSGPIKGRADFWGDTETAGYFKEAYLIDPSVSARTIPLGKSQR